MRSAVTAPIDDEPMPPERGRRWVVAVIVFLSLVAVGWMAWDRIAWRRFQAQVTRLRSAGEPVWETDFATPQVSDSENAAIVLRRAAAELVETDDQRAHATDDFFEPALTGAAVTALGRVCDANRVALEDIRRLDSMAVADFGPRASGDPESLKASLRGLNDLSEARALGQILEYAARRAHAVGDDAAAIGYIKDLLTVARVMGQRESEVAILTSAAIESLAAQEIQYECANLRVGDAPGEVRREEVKSLIVTLLDSDSRSVRMRRALAHERCYSVVAGTNKFTRELRHCDVHGGALSWSGSLLRNDAAIIDVAPYWIDFVSDRLARPYYLLAAARSLHFDLAGSTSPSPYAVPLRGARPYKLQELFGVNWVISMTPPEPSSGIFVPSRANAARNALAAVNLAARLYQIDHDGQMPATTASLVPQYLPRMPVGVTVPTVPAFIPLTKPVPVPATQPAPVPARTQPTTR